MNARAVLGVPRDASPGEVRAAWHRAARATHPDLGGDADAFVIVAAAYARLGHEAPPRGAVVVSRLSVGHLAGRWLRRRFVRGPSRVV